VHIGFAKAEATQRPEGLRPCFERLRFYNATVGAAVGVADANGGCRAVDEELAPVGGAVVGAAEGEEVFGFVGATFGAELKMVEVDEGGVAATRDAAAAVVACEDGPAQRGWGGLLGAGEGMASVGGRETLASTWARACGTISGVRTLRFLGAGIRSSSARRFAPTSASWLGWGEATGVLSLATCDETYPTCWPSQ